MTQKNNKLQIVGGGGRESGIELLRILSMICIVFHHYVVNSGLIEIIDKTPSSVNSLIAIIFGCGGKTAINCFVLITGYFMINSKITIKKYLKLLLQIEFYKILIFLLFVLTGIQDFSIKSLVESLLPINDLLTNFTSCFLVFYLCIPFLNILIKNLKKSEHLYLMLGLIFFYSIWPTLHFNVVFNYVTWFCVLYIIAAYIRLYQNDAIFNKIKRGYISLIFLALSLGSVICMYFLTKYLSLNVIKSYYFVSDSNKILALFTGIVLFIYFKNLTFHSKVVNVISSATFGVLLIHANSDAMRNWLWHDLLNNVNAFNYDWFVLHLILSVIFVYIACTSIELLRIRFVQDKLLNFVYKRILKLKNANLIRKNN